MPRADLHARGKVRDIFEAGDDLLMVATDRISAFDVVLPQAIPDKGRVLTGLSLYWFDRTSHLVANHLITADVAKFPEPSAPDRECLAERLKELTLTLYEFAAARALERGIVLADTKFEFGFAEGELILIDEVLTPDSSRFWPADRYEPGHPQPSFDKQYVRDWLDASGWDHEPPPPDLPDEVIEQTAARYREAYERITGVPFVAYLARMGAGGE